MNSVILMGRLTRDPEIRYSQGENAKAIGRFSLAVDRRIKSEGQPEVDFFNCVSFGKQAEFVEKYLHQGTKVVISGEFRNNNYTNSKGEKVYSYQLMVNTIEFAESKAASSQSHAENPTPAAQPRNAATDGFEGLEDFAEESLPF